MCVEDKYESEREGKKGKEVCACVRKRERKGRVGRVYTYVCEKVRKGIGEVYVCAEDKYK